MNSSENKSSMVPQPWTPKPAASSEQKASATTDKPLPHSVAHAAFGVACEIYRLQAWLECIATSWVVNRVALDAEIRSIASFICGNLAPLKASLGQKVIAKAMNFLQSRLGISKRVVHRKSPPKLAKQRNSLAIREPESVAKKWKNISFELNATILRADERVQRWWRAGCALGMVDVAVQSNPESVLEHLKDAQVKVKLLLQRQRLPQPLEDFGYLNLEVDAETISAKLRQICASNPQHASPVIFEEWQKQMQVAKLVSQFVFAAREGLHSMAVEQVRPKLANDARDKAMYELVVNGGTLREAVELSQDNPNYNPLNRESSAQKAIDAYARRYGLPLIRRKQTKQKGSPKSKAQ